MSPWVFVIVLFAALNAIPLAKADNGDLPARLERIRATVNQQEGEIARIRGEFNSILKERKEVEEDIERLKREERRLTAKVQELSSSRDELSRKVQEAELAVSAHQQRVTKRLRALYMNSAAHVGGSLLLHANGVDVERAAVYVRAVRARDEGAFVTIKRAVTELTERRQALDKVYTERKSTQDAAAARRADAEAQGARLQTLSDQLLQKRRAAESSLARLRSEADKLEALIASLTSGDTPAEEPNREVKPVQPPEEIPSKGSPLGTARELGDVVAPPKIQLIPGGLFSAAAQLSAPVQGSVVQRFGKVKVTDFSDMIFSKGLEFAAAVGSQVYAVLSGKVAFVGNLPGFDTVVVLDHGSRSYSLYGRLGTSLVKKGEILARDQAVGTISQPDQKGRNFYFEVRKNGTPVDPESVLKRVSR